MKTRLIGTWKLLSYETQKPDGEIVLPFGGNVKGMLVYTADGFMCGQVMNASRAPLPASYRTSGSTGDVVAAFEGYIAYCGRWRVDEQRSEVIHTVEASLYPNWVGSEQHRQVRFDGDRLTLSAETRRSGGVWISRLTWERP